MRRCTWLLLASGILVACSTQSTNSAASPSDAAPAASGVIASAADHLDVSAPRDVTTGAIPSGPDNPYGSNEGPPVTGVTPEATAADAVLQLVEDERLLALDLHLSVKVDDDGPTVVLVRVLFGSGRSHPREETYLVRLADDAEGWAVVDLEAAA